MLCVKYILIEKNLLNEWMSWRVKERRSREKKGKPGHSCQCRTADEFWMQWYLGLVHTRCVAFSKSFNLSEPYFLHPYKGDGKTESCSVVVRIRDNKSRRHNVEDLAVVVWHYGCPQRGSFSAISHEGSEKSTYPWELFQSPGSKYHLQEIVVLWVIMLSSKLICTHRPQVINRVAQLLGQPY